jgi:hypothetical protein
MTMKNWKENSSARLTFLKPYQRLESTLFLENCCLKERSRQFVGPMQRIKRTQAWYEGVAPWFF